MPMAEMAGLHRKQIDMANISPSTLAINTIAKSLANAVEAARGLDLAASQDLRSLLSIAASEVERVRKVSKKTSKSAKHSAAKRARTAELKVAPQPKGRRKQAAANGASH